jgi:hypothetical protein
MARRFLSDKEAAAEIGLELSQFKAWVQSGRLPKPLAEIDKYDLKAIDAAIDRISGLGGGTNALDAWRAKGSK